MKKKKLKSITKVKKDVWDLFSKYIRLKYSDWRGNVSCITCNKIFHWKNIQAGHFIQGRHNAVLFDERNVHPQCYSCNCCKHGNLIPYYEFMLKKYGKQVIEELKRKDKEINNLLVQNLKL